MSDDLERARQLFSDGLARHVEKNWAAAEQLYRGALQVAPDRPSIVFNLGRLMLDQDRNTEAEALFRQSLALAPDHEGSYNLGLALARQGRFGEALGQYDQAIALEAKFAAAHAGRAWALEQLARPAEALGSHARSVELAPDVPDFQSGFCRCAAQVGDGFDAGASPLLETAALICLMANRGDHQDLRILCTVLLARRFTGFRQNLAALDFDLVKAADRQAQDLQAFCGDWLLMATLEKIVLTDQPNRDFFHPPARQPAQARGGRAENSGAGRLGRTAGAVSCPTVLFEPVCLGNQRSRGRNA